MFVSLVIYLFIGKQFQKTQKSNESLTTLIFVKMLAKNFVHKNNICAFYRL